MAEESKNEETPLLGIEVPIDADASSSAIPQGDADSSFRTSERTTTSRVSYVSPPTTDSARHTGRFLLLVVALLYGSLSVSLRMVYERPGPPAASILSATRGWMTVVCLWPIILCQQCSRRGPMDPPAYSMTSFYLFCLELAFFNFGTQGLLNIGLLTTESARSAFFTQLSVVITPILAATIGLCSRKQVSVGFKVWVACFLALFGLYVLSSDDSNESSSSSSSSDSTEAFSWTYESISALVTKLVSSLSFGDWCCLGSAFCWSYYIYRLSDWGYRYDEAQTMFVKNIFMAIMYSIWTVVSYVITTFNAAPSEEAVVLMDGNSTLIDDDCDEALDDSFYLWEGWKDPIALGILFYTALSSGAISDILQQQAQAKVPAAESNVLLSLEPVFAAILAVVLLHEIPSIRECLGGLCIVFASILAST